MLRRLTALGLVIAALTAIASSAPASAFLVTHPRCHLLRCVAASQRVNLAHARYVCKHGRHTNKAWSCAAVRWLSREYAQTEKWMHPVHIVHYSSGGYAGVSAIRWAVASCESGGDPYNTHNPKYRGKWQFDQGTWDRFAPPQWRGHDPATVPELVQDWTAEHVTYDAWPNC